MIRSFFILILIIGFSSSLKSNEIVKQDLYKKIDLFGEVLDKIAAAFRASAPNSNITRFKVSKVIFVMSKAVFSVCKNKFLPIYNSTRSSLWIISSRPENPNIY